MMAPSKRLVSEYKFIVMKMSKDFPTNHVLTTNYELFCNVEKVMGLICVLFMLKAMQSLNKLIQNKNCFIVFLWQL